MIKLNWKSRFKNLNFWIGLTGAAALFIQTVLKLLDLPLDPAPVQDLLNAFFSLLAAYGVLIDPSTPGMSDRPIVSDQDLPDADDRNNIHEPSLQPDMETIIKILKGGKY